MPASADGEEVGLLDAGVSSVSPRALAALYVSHGLSAWGQRMWEFDIGLILLQLQPDSLRLVSTFGLADGGLQGLLGGAIGAYIDRCSWLRLDIFSFSDRSCSLHHGAYTKLIGHFLASAP